MLYIKNNQVWPVVGLVIIIIADIGRYWALILRSHAYGGVRGGDSKQSEAGDLLEEKVTLVDLIIPTRSDDEDEDEPESRAIPGRPLCLLCLAYIYSDYIYSRQGGAPNLKLPNTADMVQSLALRTHSYWCLTAYSQ